MKERINLKWLAGFFDGDGSIAINNHKKKFPSGKYKNYLNIVAALGQKNKKFMQYIHKEFGGHIVENGLGSGNWRVFWIDSKAISFLSKIYSYLVLKKKQVKLAFCLYYFNHSRINYAGRKGLLKEEFDLRYKIKRKVSQLNNSYWFRKEREREIEKSKRGSRI